MDAERELKRLVRRSLAKCDELQTLLEEARSLCAANKSSIAMQLTSRLLLNHIAAVRDVCLDLSVSESDSHDS